jgi:hypothetical protein
VPGPAANWSLGGQCRARRALELINWLPGLETEADVEVEAEADTETGAATQAGRRARQAGNFIPDSGLMFGTTSANWQSLKRLGGARMRACQD